MLAPMGASPGGLVRRPRAKLRGRRQLANSTWMNPIGLPDAGSSPHQHVTRYKLPVVGSVHWTVWGRAVFISETRISSVDVATLQSESTGDDGHGIGWGATPIGANIECPRDLLAGTAAFVFE